MKEGVPCPGFWGEHIQPFLRCIIDIGDGWELGGPQALDHLVYPNAGRLFPVGYLMCCEWLLIWRTAHLLFEARPQAVRAPDRTGIAFLFFEITHGKFARWEKAREYGSVHTSKAGLCWCYDLMLEKAETPYAPSLCLIREEGGVEKEEKVTEEMWKDERESPSVLSAFVTSIIPIHLLTQLSFLPLHFQCNWGFNLLRQWQNRLYFLFYCFCSGYTCLH